MRSIFKKENVENIYLVNFTIDTESDDFDTRNIKADIEVMGRIKEFNSEIALEVLSFTITNFDELQEITKKISNGNCEIKIELEIGDLLNKGMMQYVKKIKKLN